MARNLIRKSNSVNQGRSFTSLQMFHTHAPLPRSFLRPRRMRWRWRWRKDENEMTMKMRWQVLNRNTRGGTQKGKGKRENTNTNTPGPKRANPERARKKKKRTDDGPKNQPEEGGRTEAPDTTYKARAKSYLGTRRTQTWPREESAHEIGDQWGTSWWNKMHPHYVLFSW